MTGAIDFFHRERPPALTFAGGDDYVSASLATRKVGPWWV